MTNTKQPGIKERTFEEIFGKVSAKFDEIEDYRANNRTYELGDILRSGFAMFSLKKASLLEFGEQTKPEQENLKSIYRIKGLVGDGQMRAVLDEVKPEPIRAMFQTLHEVAKESGLVKKYEYWPGWVIVTVDGVQHFSSRKIHCEHCTRRTSSQGVTTYQHAGLAAVMVHPGKGEVFALDFEPIVNEDGQLKNDCERTAAKRLCVALAEKYPELGIVLVEDALYANAPHIRQITEYGWKFILNVKPDSHVSLERQFAGRLASGQVGTLEVTDSDGTRHKFSWTNHLCLCDSAVDVIVNYLLYEQTDRKGRVTRWTWVTNFDLTARSVTKIMRAGRARWKIENETFNTLKNQGYHFEHNYGHGSCHLATNLALLMFLAFTLDQLLQATWSLFRLLWQGLRTKLKLWNTLRSFFQTRRFPSMTALYLAMADSFDILLW